jgi:hypothetical protein
VGSTTTCGRSWPRLYVMRVTVLAAAAGGLRAVSAGSERGERGTAAADDVDDDGEGRCETEEEQEAMRGEGGFDLRALLLRDTGAAPLGGCCSSRAEACASPNLVARSNTDERFGLGGSDTGVSSAVSLVEAAWCVEALVVSVVVVVVLMSAVAAGLRATAPPGCGVLGSVDPPLAERCSALAASSSSCCAVTHCASAYTQIRSTH